MSCETVSGRADGEMGHSSGNSGSRPAEYFTGTSGWTYGDWKGKFYPEKLAQAHWLEYYASHFPTVEINATFYRNFPDQTYEKWRERVPAGFRYVLKAPRTITHRKYLNNIQSEVQEFWRSAAILREKLGLILLQVSPGTPYDLHRLENALRAFGDPTHLAVEFRNEHWLTPETFALLRELKVAYCNPDSPVSRLSDIITSQVGYIRLHGRDQWYLYNYNEEELQEIAAVARRMVQNGAGTVYTYFNNDFKGYAAQNAQRLIDILSKG